MLTPLFGWQFGTVEIVVLALIVLLLFGHRLPAVMFSLGKGLTDFKKGMSSTDTDDEPATVTDKKPE